MSATKIGIEGAKLLILGIMFKENCPDVRNTKVVDVVTSLQKYGEDITIYDPWANVAEVKQEYGLESTQYLPQGEFDAIVLTVAHLEFGNLDFACLQKHKAIIYDVKNKLPSNNLIKTL